MSAHIGFSNGYGQALPAKPRRALFMFVLIYRFCDSCLIDVAGVAFRALPRPKTSSQSSLGTPIQASDSLVR